MPTWNSSTDHHANRSIASRINDRHVIGRRIGNVGLESQEIPRTVSFPKKCLLRRRSDLALQACFFLFTCVDADPVHLGTFQKQCKAYTAHPRTLTSPRCECGLSWAMAWQCRANSNSAARRKAVPIIKKKRKKRETPSQRKLRKSSACERVYKNNNPPLCNDLPAKIRREGREGGPVQ